MNSRRAARLSLDLLRAFRSAARHLSFTRAAREQFVTQSAISRAIRTLEDQLGQPLFHRVNRALTLTHAGEELYRASDEALALIDTATDRLTGSAGALAVTTTTALASTWLVPRLPRSARYARPQTSVRTSGSNSRPLSMAGPGTTGSTGSMRWVSGRSRPRGRCASRTMIR